MIDVSWKSCVGVLVAATVLIASGCDQHHSGDAVPQTVGAAAAGLRSGDVAVGTDVLVEDAELTAKVRAAIFAETALQSQQIDVITQESVVTLEGAVDSPSLRERAIQIAGAVDGVLQVRDKLEVRS